MVKTNIDVKVQIKVKSVDVEEYEIVMDTYRASMLFFERELRKLNDKKKLSTKTLHKISNKMDFTELLRLSFLSIKDNERMKLVKLDEVAEAIQRVQTYSKTQLEQKQEPIRESYPTIQATTQHKFDQLSLSEQEMAPISTKESTETQNQIEYDFNDPNFDSIKDINKPDVNIHSSILQRNTASAVIELRKMMYNNLKKIRNTLGEQNK